MDYVITMQYLENYGIHNDKPVHYWKPKGGEVYVIRNAPERQATVVACLNIVKATTDSVGYQSYITDILRGTYGFEESANDAQSAVQEIEWSELEAEANKAFPENELSDDQIDKLAHQAAADAEVGE
tara:strand:+ start:2873 stop:3253 length:381 start_codon:yes stop_codon:yes gene_type:complete